jgi:hypothetical protein
MNTKALLGGLLLAFSLAFPLALRADGLNGPEFSFSNRELIECARSGKLDMFSALVSAKLQSLYGEMRKVCLDCRFSDFIRNPSGFSKFKVILPSGKTIFVHADDWVVEVGMTPMTLTEIRANQELVDRVLFEAAKKVGLSPQPRIGGGHQHLDLESYFHGDAVLFRNFVVDLMNRPELFLGGLSLDLLNAPPLAVLSKRQIAEFARVVAEFDRHPTSIRTLKDRINKRVYTRTYVQSRSQNRELLAFMARQEKFQAINLLHPETVEIRGLTPPRRMGDFYFRSLLFSSRIDRLREMGKVRIPFFAQNLRDAVGWSVERRVEQYRVDLPEQRISRAVNDYIAAAGLDAKLLRPHLIPLSACEAALGL